MDDSSNSRAGGAVVGFLVGGAVGFVMTEGFAAFSHVALDATLSVEDTPALLLVFIGVPLLCAVVGGVVGLRLASRKGR
ncbi:hypothetical protein ACFY4C_00815 [Actinomadura viridis]|uniref:hypothetical protein n=1 Tax=Actinomadura viridis TaxID=58110 RepID=UPI003690C586